MNEKIHMKMTDAETYTLRNRTGEAAETMASSHKGDGEARAAYSRLLVEESKSFGAYVSKKIGTRFKRAS